MAMVCPQCSLELNEQTLFCPRCGYRLVQNNPTSVGTAAASYVTNPTNEQQQYNPPGQIPPGSYTANQPNIPGTQQPYIVPLTQYAGTNYAPPPPPSSFLTQLGRQAQAGYGTPAAHHAWLIPDKQALAIPLLSATRDSLLQHGMVGVQINQLHLAEKGGPAEGRDYYTVQRGPCTLFLHIIPSGRDLYISRATTVKTPISYIRVALLVLMLIVFIYGLTQYTSLHLTGNALGDAIATTAITLITPLLVLFVGLIIASVVAWIIYKDAAMYLRPSTLSDFQLDDAMLLENMLDSCLQEAAQGVGIDPAFLRVPPRDSRQLRRFRWI